MEGWGGGRHLTSCVFKQSTHLNYCFVYTFLKDNKAEMWRANPQKHTSRGE